MDLDWTNIVNVLLMVASMVLAGKWKGAKNTAKNGVAIAELKTTQAINIANRIIRAAEDDHVTPEEVQDIVLGVKEFLPQKEV